MIKITQLPDEDVSYDFDDYIDFESSYSDRMVIYGNRDFIGKGQAILIQVIKGDYYDYDETEIENDDGTVTTYEIGYDYETAEELEKLSGKKGWEQTTIRGYSQSDWQEIWYVKDEVTADEIQAIEDLYFGKMSEVKIEDNGDEYIDLIPHSVFWQGKKAICDHFGFKNYDEVEIYDYEGELID